MQNLNIIELIEKNPITKLSETYNNKLLNKIKENFSEFEQQLFVSSFYCYLNYDKNIDFVVNLDDIWKWLGFAQKVTIKLLLEKFFKKNIDYKIISLENIIDNNNTNKTNGGHNKQIFMLTIKCFKSLCLKAQTNKASEIHEYYIKLGDILQELVEEQTTELKYQLEQKENIIIEIQKTSEKEKEIFKIEKQREIEKVIISQYPVNTECIYFGTIDNTNHSEEKLIKFGNTNDLSTRVMNHRKTYNNFILINAFKVENKVEIENLIKKNPKIKKQIRCIDINDKKKTEIIAYNYNDFTIENISKIIKDIIDLKRYSIDNFNRIIRENEKLNETINFLENKSNELKEIVKTQELQIQKKSAEIMYLQEKIEKYESQLESIKQFETISVYQNVLLPEDEIHKKFNDFVNEICIVRPDVEEISVNIEGRYRLWCQTKPTKEIFHALKNYLDIRFKPKRLASNRNHGYVGIRLKEVEYKRTNMEKYHNTETFIFNTCMFSDTGKILNSVLLREYRIWKTSIGKEITDNDMKDIKEYLNTIPYTLKATVWTNEGCNEGYYGISLKRNEYNSKIISSTGKKVYKLQVNTEQLLGTWDTIAKAAETEGISPAKMSRYIKNKTILGDYYYIV